MNASLEHLLKKFEKFVDKKKTGFNRESVQSMKILQKALLSPKFSSTFQLKERDENTKTNRFFFSILNSKSELNKLAQSHSYIKSHT